MYSCWEDVLVASKMAQKFHTEVHFAFYRVYSRCDVPIKVDNVEAGKEKFWAKFNTWKEGADTLSWGKSINQIKTWNGHPALGLPLRYTEPSGDHYSPRNYGRKYVWEVCFDVDTTQCSADGWLAATFVKQDLRNTRKMYWETAVRQPVCSGDGTDDGSSQQYIEGNKVHYIKCGALTSIEEFNQDKCYIGQV